MVNEQSLPFGRDKLPTARVGTGTGMKTEGADVVRAFFFALGGDWVFNGD